MGLGTSENMPDIVGRRVLIVTLGTRGDVQPFLVLAHALKRAGAIPLLLTLPQYVHLGIEFDVAVSSLLEDGMSWPDMNALSDGGVENRDEFEDSLVLEPYARFGRTMLRRIERAASEAPPDIVVVGMIVWFVQWLRETLFRPLIHVHLQPTRWLTTERSDARSWRRSQFIELLTTVPWLDGDFLMARIDRPEELHLLAYPEGIGVTHLPGVRGERTGFWHAHARTEGATPPLLPAALLDFLTAAGQPRAVCLNFGSMPVYTRTPWIDALLGVLEAHCRGGGRLIAIGSLVPEALRSWPATLVISSAPHALVLPLCGCVIHHGGAGTSAAAVHACVPSLVVPHLTWIDQTRWARWLESLHAGVWMRDEERTHNEFAHALHRVLHDASLREGVRALARRLAADGGVDEAVRLIRERLCLNPLAIPSSTPMDAKPLDGVWTVSQLGDTSWLCAKLVQMARDLSGDDSFGVCC